MLRIDMLTLFFLSPLPALLRCLTFCFGCLSEFVSGIHLMPQACTSQEGALVQCTTYVADHVLKTPRSLSIYPPPQELESCPEISA